ncbi:hypothetical protein HYFRA_00013367 [Hymenoscyphus fraxineus]|uniref:Mid2 domain-containing protein n=1 Tax=Hymenoscyphus fraxineus TaxID=746836 RepID=A0A9N9L987_9HELO|nr:hypothetical protein HYFRA_00013367 [Hymenoscyphus fraxineus]
MNSFKTLILVLTVGDSLTNALTHYRPKDFAGSFRGFMLKAREERQETATVTAGTWTGMLWASAPDASILVPVESITSIITQTRTTALGTLTESIIVTPTVFVRPSDSWAPGSRTSIKPSTSSLPSSQQSEETQQPTPDPTNLFAPATPSSSRFTQNPTVNPTTGSITTSPSQTPTVLSSSTSPKGLSPGAKAGLGVGVTLGVVALLAGLFWALRTRRRISTLERTIQFSPTSRDDPAPVPPPKYPPRDNTANAAMHGLPQNRAALWRVSRVGGGKEMEGTRYEKVVDVDDNEEHMGPPIPRKSSRRSSSVRPISPVPESLHTHPNSSMSAVSIVREIVVIGGLGYQHVEEDDSDEKRDQGLVQVQVSLKIDSKNFDRSGFGAAFASERAKNTNDEHIESLLNGILRVETALGYTIQGKSLELELRVMIMIRSNKE